MALNSDKISRGDTLEYDKNGVPLYSGQPHLLEEYRDRAWDLFHGRVGNPGLQATTPIHLRSGCRGTVYEAVRSLKHESLVTWRPETFDTEGEKIAAAFVEGDEPAP